MEGKRIAACRLPNGRIGLSEEDIPPLKPGAVLVKVRNSLVSPGTELNGGWRALKEQWDNPPAGAKKRPFGYSNSGVVLEVGQGVEEFKPGDRVACVGVGYAVHANFAVAPHNLCVALPDKVSHAQGAYAMLAATALNALRRGQPQFGEYAAVVGLGILGQLTAQLYQLAGNYVIGWEMIPLRVEIARQWGIHETALVGQEDEIEKTRAFTRGYGLDAAVFAVAGRGDQAFARVEKCLKCSPDGHPMGTLVIVGGMPFDYTARTTNFDIRRASRTGPGYHDEAWEFGADYPPVFMRWTTRTNLELCMRLIAEGKLKVDGLTTHVIPLARVEEGLGAIIHDPDRILGVVFQMEHSS